MNRHKHYSFGMLWILLLLSQSVESFSWFSTTKKVDSSKKLSVADIVGEFSVESLNSKKGMMLIEKAKRKAAVSNSCWQNAYQNLFAGCSEILAGEEQRSRLSWHLSDCFQKDTGRSPYPYCDVKAPMVNCLKKLNVDAHKVYLEFYLETNSICHQLQADAFKRQTERVVNELKRSAEYTEDKLEKIENKAEQLLHTSDHIQESLTSIDVQTQQVSQTSENIKEHVSVVLQHSQSVYEQSLKLADSQTELHDGQMKMNERLNDGMMMLNEGMNNIRNETVEIEKEITKVGDFMFMKMDTLQSKADDIENVTETSLEKQKQLLDSQTTALDVLKTVTIFQSQALEESRGTLQKLIELGHSQEQLKQAHDHLVENSKTILATQEILESKQASMSLVIDKLFTIHNAFFLISRVTKAFLVYPILLFTLCMFTGTKETYNVRSKLYIGLCVTFLIEYMMLRYCNDIEQLALIISIVRKIFVLPASCQLFYAVYTYSDYEILNHETLRSNGQMSRSDGQIERSDGQIEQMLFDDDDDVDWSLWVDTDLPEDDLEDADWMLPEEVWEGLIITSVPRQYNLRYRHL